MYLLSFRFYKSLMSVSKELDFVEQLGFGMERVLSIYDKDIYKIPDNFIFATSGDE